MVRARLALLPLLALLPALPASAQPRDTLETGAGTFARPVLASSSSLEHRPYAIVCEVVMTHAPGRLPAGEHEYRWKPAALAPGVYWVALRLDGRLIAPRALVSR